MRLLSLLSPMAFMLLLPVTSLIADSDPLYPPRTDLIPLTSKLPEPDAIEIAVISPDGVTPLQKTVSAHSLSPAEVTTFTRLWRSQHWSYTDHSGLDDPHYRVRFYQNKSMFLEATIMRSSELWDIMIRRCNLKIRLPGDTMFDSRTAEGREFRRFLERLPGESRGSPNGYSADATEATEFVKQRRAGWSKVFVDQDWAAFEQQASQLGSDVSELLESNPHAFDTLFNNVGRFDGEKAERVTLLLIYLDCKLGHMVFITQLNRQNIEKRKQVSIELLSLLTFKQHVPSGFEDFAKFLRQTSHRPTNIME